ncbi:aspartic peptidase domain-containing protein [Xylariaceae sp. FL1272]|nr:aspartic peptidase domain-containing protein [Xylariaceae sp. FL1272]
MATIRLASCVAIFLVALTTLNYTRRYMVLPSGGGMSNRPRIVSFPLSADSQRLPIIRREEFTDIRLYLSIGTPQQNVKVLVDTNVSPLWVSVACYDDDVSTCEPSYGNYDPSQSSTSSLIPGTANITYSDGGDVSLHYYSDTYAFSTGVDVKGVEFGVTNITGVDNGVLGLGLPQEDDHYPNLIHQLASQGRTNSKAFSLAVGSPSSESSDTEGVIIFGGIDKKKFSGLLSTNDIIIQNASYPDYIINMASVGVGTLDGGEVTNLTDSNTTVTIGSGAVSSYLPPSTVMALSKYFNASITDELHGRYGLPCASVANSTSFVSFNFAGVAIEVPFSALVFQYSDDSCQWGIQPNTFSGNTTILGIQFLQYAYAVSGVAELELVGDCMPVRNITTPSSSSNGSSSSSGTGLSTGVKAGIGVGVGVGVVALAVLAYFLLGYKRRRRAKMAKESQDQAPYRPHPETSEDAQPDNAAHEMQAEQLPGAHTGYLTDIQEAPCSPYDETTGHQWSSKWQGHNQPISELASEEQQGVTTQPVSELPSEEQKGVKEVDVPPTQLDKHTREHGDEEGCNVSSR